MDTYDEFKALVIKIQSGALILLSLIVVFMILVVNVMINPSFFDFNNEKLIASEEIVEVDEDLIVDGIHVRTGLIDDEGLMTVVNNCTNCHSSKLVTQNRMNKERWAEKINWMQTTQGLWDLGKNETVIIDYLVKNYPPLVKGRRQTLTNIDWYILEE